MIHIEGLTRSAFVGLLDGALFDGPDLESRARQILEFGRMLVREDGHAEPHLIAIADTGDPPVLRMALPELPLSEQPELRAPLIDRIASMGAKAVFLLATQQVGAGPGRLLVAWGEGADGAEVVWMLPYRMKGSCVQEAAALLAPDPERTEISRRCRGLLPRLQ